MYLTSKLWNKENKKTQECQNNSNNDDNEIKQNRPTLQTSALLGTASIQRKVPSARPLIGGQRETQQQRKRT